VPAYGPLDALLALLLVGGAVAAVTFDRGVATAVSMIRVVAILDVGAIPVGEVVVLVAVFVSFAAATHSLDRLVVGGIRAVLAGRD
jgi:hypothetical protein